MERQLPKESTYTQKNLFTEVFEATEWEGPTVYKSICWS